MSREGTPVELPQKEAEKSESVANVQPKMTRKTTKPFKILAISNLHHLKPPQIFRYIVQLHKKIRRLMRKLEKYKTNKQVSMMSILQRGHKCDKISFIAEETARGAN